MNRKKSGKKSDVTFEKALSRLDEIVNELESGEKGLEESIALFEEGSRLSQLCREQLERAQGKIEKLVETAAGQTTVNELEATQ